MRALAIALLGLVSLTLYAQDKTDPKIEQELIRLEHEWTKADLDHDIAWYEKYLSEDFTATNTKGQLETKQQAIAMAKKGLPIREEHAVDDLKVRVYGNAAVVTGRVTTRQGRTKDSIESYQLRFTDVFVRKNGRWQVVATQGTRISN